MPAAPAHPSRAERRRAPAPRSSRRLELPALSDERTWQRLLAALWVAATLVLLVLTAIGIERRITWYLAVDQYGYLAFAHDLMHGKVFHHWAPIEALAPALPPRVDVLVQTYVYDRGWLYCRYAPGFPILLAGWLSVFGDDGAHYLNPTVFLALLVLVLAFVTRLGRSRWHGTVGVALVVLCPTLIHLWALTLVRDLATHLAAFLGLFLLLPAHDRHLGAGRAAAAGLALGFAGSTRPDALLYLVPALLLAAARWRREGAGPGRVVGVFAVGTLGVVLGLSPSLGYNWAATGNPLHFTQGMEVANFLPGAEALAPNPPPPQPEVGYPPGAWRGGTAQAVQGGGLQLANLRRVLPENVNSLRRAYSDLLLGLAVWGALLAFFQRRMLFLAAVPYCVLALLFYSCWGRSDPRYLSGLHLFVPMLVIEGTLGTLEMLERLASRDEASTARGLALIFAVVLLAGGVLIDAPGTGTLFGVAMIVSGVGAAAALLAAIWQRRRIVAAAAPVLALALVTFAGYRAWTLPARRATFQGPEMRQARATFASTVEPGAVVITTEDIGRPAENIDYYTGVDAFYLTDLERWQLPVPRAAELLARGGMKPYLFIPATQRGRARMLRELREQFAVELAADIPAAQAVDYFVAAAFHHGVRMGLYRLVWRGSPAEQEP